MGPFDPTLLRIFGIRLPTDAGRNETRGTVIFTKHGSKTLNSPCKIQPTPTGRESTVHHNSLVSVLLKYIDADLSHQ